MKALYYNLMYRIAMVHWHLAQQRRDYGESLIYRREADRHYEAWELETWERNCTE